MKGTPFAERRRLSAFAEPIAFEGKQDERRERVVELSRVEVFGCEVGFAKQLLRANVGRAFEWVVSHPKERLKM